MQMKLPNSRSCLKQKIIENKLIPYKCQLCGLENEWNKKPLSLQLDHIDGNRINNELSNLRFLCPNCHSQTPTFARGNKKRISILYKDMKDQILAFIDECDSCRQLIFKFGLSDHSTQYQKVYRVLGLLSDHPKVIAFKARQLLRQQEYTPRPERRKVIRPTKEELEKLIWTKPSSQLSKEFGLNSSNTLLQWCRIYGITKPPRGYWVKQKYAKNQIKEV